MAFKFSTGFRNAVMGTASAATTLTGGKIKIYSGAPPVTADAAATGTLLITISDNGGSGGLSFEPTITDATLTKLATQVWKGTIAATGTAGYFRWVMGSDDGSPSTTQVRIQGTVAQAGGDMNLSSLTVTASEEQVLDYFTLTFPTA